MSEQGTWTEADQAYADFVAEIACEVSESEDVVAWVLGALEERGLFSVSEAVKLMMTASETAPPPREGEAP